MKKIFNLLLFTLGLNSLSAQTLPTFQAPEPSKVFEFTKYDQIPVGEYTGVPAISLPLHSLKVDDVEIPIGLQYHAGGIRTTEEASNVGLGWNMNFGQISQTINDKDDLLLVQYRKKLLRYQKAVYPVIYEWPMNCFNLSATTCQLLPNGTNCTPEPTFVTSAPSVLNSIFIATNGYPLDPLEGKSFCATKDEDVTDFELDTEPDIFRVNFFGHSLKFIKRFDTTNGTIEILNNKGYKIEMFTDAASTINWKVITPDGDQYIFGKYRQDYNSTSTDGITPDFMRSGGNSYTNNWSLIKIITNKNKVIDFEYTDFGQTKTNSYSQKLMIISNMVTSNFSPPNIGQITSYANFSDGFFDGTGSNIYPLTYSAMYEKMIYVSKITTPTETVTFQYSDRTDRMNDKKMDQIVIKNLKSEIFKTFNFSYNYFTATETGNLFVISNPQGSPNPNPAILPTHNTQRLKLLSVQQVGSNPYTFVYDANILPRKTSTAVDFWGFYNGKTTNTSLAPNPASVGYPALGNNGNDKSAYIDYAKASTLKEIIYPTGGKISYEYELNEYERAAFETVLPNAGNVTGTSTKGNGIRIKSISLSDRNVPQKKTNYSYAGGISLVPFEIMKHYSAATAKLMSTGTDDPFPYYHCSTFSVDEFHNTNFQRPALLGSYNMVGYSEVTMTEIGLSGNGKTVYKFANKRDEKSFHQHDYMLGIEMPSLMDINATENGKILSEEIYADGNTTPILKKEYSYSTLKSNIFYGNLIVPFRNRIGFDCGSGNCWAYYKPQHLVGYYAIYDKQSLLDSEKVTETFNTGSKWNITNYSYDANNRIYNKANKDQFGNILTSESTVFQGSPALTAKNWLTLPAHRTVVQNGQSQNLNYFYTIQGDLTLPSYINMLPISAATEYETKVIYDLYDDIGNLLQFHNNNGINTCVIWGYKKSLPIAKIENASYSEFSSLVANLQSLSDIGTPANLNAALNSLRTALPNAMVTTYTHIPSVGVSTITDPKGNTTTYNYDTSNRLLYVKDKDNKILSKNEYNYRPLN